MTKTKVLAGLYSYIPSGGSKGESVSLPFPDSRGYMCSLAPGPHPSSKPELADGIFFVLPSLTFKDLCDYVGGT